MVEQWRQQTEACSAPAPVRQIHTLGTEFGLGDSDTAHPLDARWQIDSLKLGDQSITRPRRVFSSQSSPRSVARAQLARMHHAAQGFDEEEVAEHRRAVDADVMRLRIARVMQQAL